MKKKCLFFLAIAVSAGLGLGSISGAAFAKQKEVAYLSLADYTGPIAGLNVPADMGLEDFIKETNAKGGIEGIRVKFIGIDTRYDVARAVSAYKRYRRTKRLLMVNSISTGIGKALARLIERDKRAQLVPGDGEFQAHLGRTFIWGPAYQDAFAAMMDWVMEDWTAKGKSGAPVVGYLNWDNPYGREPLRGGREYAESLGITMLPPEFFPPGTLKHDVYLNRLAEGGAHYIYAGGVDPTPTNVIRDAHALGLTKRIQFLNGYWGPTALGIGIHAEALEGTAIVSFFQRGTDALNNKVPTELWKKYRGSLDKFNEVYGMGMSWGMTYVAGLKNALKAVGYNKLNADEVYKAYQRITGLERSGVQGPCAYSPSSRRGSLEVKIYRVKGGKIVPVTDWRKAPDAVSLHEF
ncbi:MAG: ABC transporter substrate-binding protein [Deltaproteobacteria bacterium]|nr:ABC transporter substrate-binding protein [Deltaproteobacteria bacterium]MBW2077364.1 ABC transporter substrate-binding protein [Deltaproteobacteria bacterium]